MINNEQTGSLNATRSCSYGSQRRSLPPKSLRGVYYALRGGNHVMHFKQSHWKKLVRGAINYINRTKPSFGTFSITVEELFIIENDRNGFVF